MKIVPFDRARHGDFVIATFLRSTSDGWPWSMVPSRTLLADFWRRTMEPGAAFVVAESPTESQPNDLTGWAAGGPGELIFAYVKYTRRRFGVGAELARAVGVDVSRPPVLVRYWTRACERIATAHPGLLVSHVIEDEEDKERCAASD